MDNFLKKGTSEHLIPQPQLHHPCLKMLKKMKLTISASFLILERQASTPRKLDKTIIINKNMMKALTLTFINVNNLPYSDLCNKTYSNIITEASL